MSKQLTRIGSTEVVSLLEGKGYVDVAAKIDTGADFSSIWASNIVEKDGLLSFSLFGPGSKHYTGERLQSSEYGIAVVKNSFGQVESRYTVKLSLRIAGLRLRVEFRLADRSLNRFPILIGKRTLQNRFLVDVGAASRSSCKVLVLNSKQSNSVKNFVNQINAAGEDLACDFHTYDDFAIIADKKGLDVVSIKNGKSIRGYDLIYFKSFFKKAEIAAAIAEFAQANSLRFMDKEVASYHSYTKVSQYARLARMGLPIPRTIVLPYEVLELKFDWLVKKLGLPFILKDAAADKGLNNYLIKDEKEFVKIAREAKQNETYYVAQKFIENDGDYRLIVLGRNVSLVIGRQRQDDTTHLNNTSRGGKADITKASKLPPGLKSLAVTAAISLKRTVAGVDLIQDKHSGKWYILEVNNSPQMASGAYVDEKAKVFAKFLKNYSNR